MNEREAPQINKGDVLLLKEVPLDMLQPDNLRLGIGYWVLGVGDWEGFSLCPVPCALSFDFN